ncbi:hypothetical protein TNCV_1716611 [Trichonephila clavipes]|nr:hypothetical protein TNCV_1716611 [Trichonephila clavipes]
MLMGFDRSRSAQKAVKWNVLNGDEGSEKISAPTPLNYKYNSERSHRSATAGSDVMQSGRPIFDDFFQHLWPYIGYNTANDYFQMVKRLWLIRIDQ